MNQVPCPVHKFQKFNLFVYKVRPSEFVLCRVNFAKALAKFVFSV